MLNGDPKFALGDIQSADYVAPHLVTKTMVGKWCAGNGSPSEDTWSYQCTCGHRPGVQYPSIRLMAACPMCDTAWKRPDRTINADGTGRTMSGNWCKGSASEWKYTCCGATSVHANAHLQAACACGV